MLVGPLPPPYYGQSVSFKMLVDNLDAKVDTLVVDYSSQVVQPGSGFSFRRVFEYASILIYFCWKCLLAPKGTRIYLTIAQSKSGFFRDFVMIWFASLMGREVVVHLKGGNYDGFYHSVDSMTQWLVRKTLRKVDTIIVLGNALIGMFDFDVSLKKKIKVVMNGLPMELEEIEGHNKPAGQKVRLLFLSNLIMSKGYLDLVKALGKLKQNGLDFHADFCGRFMTSPDDIITSTVEEREREFFSLIKGLDLDENVEYHGVVSGDTKTEMLTSADIFVLSTNYINEGQPVSIIEALAYSSAIVTTRYRSIVDMIDDGKEGWFVEYGDAVDMADKLEELIRDERKLTEMQRAAHASYLNKFTQSRHISNMEAILLAE